MKGTSGPATCAQKRKAEQMENVFEAKQDDTDPIEATQQQTPNTTSKQRGEAKANWRSKRRSDRLPEKL